MRREFLHLTPGQQAITKKAVRLEPLLQPSDSPFVLTQGKPLDIPENTTLIYKGHYFRGSEPDERFPKFQVRINNEFHILHAATNDLQYWGLIRADWIEKKEKEAFPWPELP